MRICPYQKVSTHTPSIYITGIILHLKWFLLLLLLLGKEAEIPPPSLIHCD